MIPDKLFSLEQGCRAHLLLGPMDRAGTELLLQMRNGARHCAAVLTIPEARALGESLLLLCCRLEGFDFAAAAAEEAARE